MISNIIIVIIAPLCTFDKRDAKKTFFLVQIHQWLLIFLYFLPNEKRPRRVAGAQIFYCLSMVFIVGNNKTSRMAGESVSSMHIRSIP